MRCQEQARKILTAWSDGDYARMGKLLDSRGPAPTLVRVSSQEQERRELLDGIRAGLRNGDSGRNGPAVRVSLRLLRHLATTPQV